MTTKPGTAADELTESEVARLRSLLLDRRAALIAGLERSEDGAQPVDLDEPIGRLSRMEAMQQQKMTSANRLAQEQELREIALALADMDSGDYGWCRLCDEPIGGRRLEVRPHSRVCVNCQGKLETS